jgi:phage gpG-like protein
VNLRFTVNVKAPVDRFAQIARTAQKPDRILRRWAGYFGHTAKSAATTQEGWPGWAGSTQKKYEYTRTAKVTAAGEVRKVAAQHLASHLRRQARQGVGTAAGDLAELGRLQAGGTPNPEHAGGKAIMALSRALARAKRTGKRVGGDKRVVGKKVLLGRLPKMNQIKITGTTVRQENLVPWSDVHNSGGSAGHGAQEPARTWLSIDEQDQVVLREIVRDSLLGGTPT